MPTRITQIERPGSETSALKGTGKNREESDCYGSESGTRDSGAVPTVFKVEGTLHLQDAELLEKICRDVCSQTKRPVTLELAGLSYLDSESAAVLCRMKREQNVRLEGLHLFIEKVVELTEESEKAMKYMPKPKVPADSIP
jgi:anti-anti-sigma regulatory factor